MVAMIGMTMVLGQSAGPRSMGPVAVTPLVNPVLPAIIGTAQEGVTLTASTGIWTGSPTSYAWQWRRGGVDISGATASTYTAVFADVGTTLTVRVTASKAGTPDVAATSAATAVVSAAATPVPVNTAVPAITGTAQVGQTLTASTGIWTNSPTSFTYQWNRNGVPIGGATGSTRVIDAGAVGAVNSVTVTAINAGGSSLPATSANTATIIAAASSPVTAIAADGWRAAYPSPPTLNPVGSPVTLAVTRQGFNASGAGVTVTDTLTLMKRVRQPFPNQATLTADQVALSDFVHASDTLPAGVTNNSALAYPQPIAMWLTPPRERTRTGTFTARLAVAHAYARGGRPVAAVKFIASDGTNTVEQTVSTLSSRQWASGLWSDYFEVTINTSALTAGVICSLDAIIYPWVGVPFQASVHGSAEPSPNFHVLRFLNDRTGSYGEAFAYVNATSGNNGTGVVSATAATAAASPYLTVAAAVTAVQTFNNATYGRNSPSGGTVRLMPGTHVHGTFAATISGDIPLLIEGMGATRADTIYQDPGSTPSNNNRLPGRLKMVNLTIRKVGDNITLLDNNATLATMDRMLVFQNIGMDLNGTTGRAAYINRTGRFYCIDSDLMSGALASQSNVAKAANVVGCTTPGIGSAVYNAVATRSSGSGLGLQPGAGDLPAAEGQLMQHCFVSQGSDANKVMDVAGATIGPRGFAVVGTILEHFGGTTSPALSFAADGQTQTIENAVLIGNTVVGSRTNWLYQDVGTATVAKRGFMRNMVNTLYNCKTDMFVPNANLVGNWPAAFKVGSRNNVALRGGSDGSGVGTGSWLGELAELGFASGTTTVPLAPAWVDDRSFFGTGTGGGDYTPGAGSALPLIPAGMAPYSIDQKGRAYANDGTARAGALQRP